MAAMSDLQIPAFTPAPPVVTPTPAAVLMDGGPLLLMEAALVKRLHEAFPLKVFTHKTVPARLTLQGWARITEKLPMVGLAFGKAEPQKSGGRSSTWDAYADWTVFLAVRGSTPREQMFGSIGSRIDVAGMMAVAVSALHGLTIDGAGTAQVTAATQAYDEAWTNEDIGLAAVTLTVPFSMIDRAGLALLDDLLTIGMRWPTQPDTDNFIAMGDAP
jgi:phage gp37-like protein